MSFLNSTLGSKTYGNLYQPYLPLSPLRGMSLFIMGESFLMLNLLKAGELGLIYGNC